MTAAQLDHLDDQGYLILPDFMSPAQLAALRARVDELYALEGDQAGSEFKPEPFTRRLANCIDKGGIFLECVADPAILAGVAAVIGPDYKLSSVNVRSANPLSEWSQPLHCDMGGLPDERGNWVCNTIWILDDFTADNGPTRCVPGSHKSGRRPEEVLADPAAPHPDEIRIIAPAGTVVVMNSHLWHGGTANRTARPRTAMHGFFCRRDKPQQQYQKRLLRAEVQAKLTPAQRWLLALDDPLNDELSADVAVRSGFLR
ncbi:MAG: phytanoyl-CoA dioxygenase family protein [Bryobacteraceae bacterium]|nr:phytanoyl-CoA dioxygenase family protein [Bryobacteraceae bacterium]